MRLEPLGGSAAERMFTRESIGSRTTPFALAAAVAAISLFVGDAPPDASTATMALALTVIMGALPFLLIRLQLPAAVDLIVPMTYFLVVTLMREAQGGSRSGLSVLVLLPVVWLALYGTRRQLVLALAACALTLALPIALVGEPAYPGSEWRRAIITTMVASIVGMTVQRLVDTIQGQSRTDPLTGLPNRRTLEERMELEIAAARRSHRPLSLAFIDLDHFKALNDRDGHAAGDRVIVESGAAWRRELRAADFLARIGGEEFVALLPDCGQQEALEIGERLRLATPAGMTSSAGLVTWDGRESAGDLLERADRAMFAAKAAGRDRVVLG